MRTPRLLFALLLVASLGAQIAPREPFVGSTEGVTYYWTRGSCRTWRQLKPENLRWFKTAAEAEAARYRPSRTPECQAPPAR